jgi:hypothetical protein
MANLDLFGSLGRSLSVTDRPLKRLMITVDDSAAGKSKVTLLNLAPIPDVLFRA